MEEVYLPNGQIIFRANVTSPEQAMDYLNLYVLARMAVNDQQPWMLEAAEAMAEAYVARWGM